MCKTALSTWTTNEQAWQLMSTGQNDVGRLWTVDAIRQAAVEWEDIDARMGRFLIRGADCRSPASITKQLCSLKIATAGVNPGP